MRFEKDCKRHATISNKRVKRKKGANMKNPITTKDMLVLNELILFEQWAATKFRHYYDAIDDKSVKKLIKEGCLAHSDRHEALFDYLQSNASANGGEE